MIRQPKSDASEIRSVALTGAATSVAFSAAYVRNRRILLLATYPSEGLLTEPTAGAQVGRRELVFMPEAVEKRVIRQWRRAVFLGHDDGDAR